MTNHEDSRDRIAYLRQLALDSINHYDGNFSALERLDRDLESVIRSLEEVADPSWTSSLLRLWGQLEIIYASMLDEGRFRLTQDDEVYVQEVVAKLVAELQSYELPPVRDTGEEPR
ncbi:hypothetical protein [Mycobacterium persicum]|uniref:Uncharacterized protein n=1 Tax=Mycobacterium persicum TaxID=1487726 RepID=A0A1X0LE88_9MYCO|nr:hypothetical protein [Mycobacterium persicum]ORB91188.1 hypothetical protein B1T49_20320 [Mycobacterium persicum]ORB96481.1 hypothetical protein B1T44_20510 [Mycobacterium persicum]ORC03195.1 hypothetical protein B1T48_20055 [Mycobacterium persicum]ORC08643.1 hypothetical protein B4U45_20635 [Mycobacterium persicum]VAZ72545.1 hypothetical protein LAUMK15_01362 [Mycobacterium persicum]